MYYLDLICTSGKIGVHSNRRDLGFTCDRWWYKVTCMEGWDEREYTVIGGILDQTVIVGVRGVGIYVTILVCGTYDWW